MLSEEDGLAAVGLARASIAHAVGADGPARFATAPAGRVFDEPRGVFVTLKQPPDGLLRGCIGYPLPVLPLRDALVRAAVGAALHDPRFPPVDPVELPELTLEVSVLTVPELLRAPAPEGIVSSVRVGRDGLLIEAGRSSGLLLPQVAPEEGWDALELLEGTCAKAGLSPGAWMHPAVRVHRFQAEVFRELAPGGTIVRDVPDPIPDGARPAR